MKIISRRVVTNQEAWGMLQDLQPPEELKRDEQEIVESVNNWEEYLVKSNLATKLPDGAELPQSKLLKALATDEVF